MTNDWLKAGFEESAEYKAGMAAAEREADGSDDCECPYAYTDYTDTPYRRWMAGYWKICNVYGASQ